MEDDKLYECPAIDICNELGTSDMSCFDLESNINKEIPRNEAYLEIIGCHLYTMQKCLRSIVLLLGKKNPSASDME